MIWLSARLMLVLLTLLLTFLNINCLGSPLQTLIQAKTFFASISKGLAVELINDACSTGAIGIIF